MTQPLMPLATAVWLVENTSLTFEQIANYCGLHEMEIQSVADGEIATNLRESDPIVLGQLDETDLKDCEKDSKKQLTLISVITDTGTKKRKTKYIPIAKRRDKPDAIAWIIKNHPDLPDSKIIKLIGTTKKTIESIRNRSYANIGQLQAKDPVMLGLCSQSEIDGVLEKEGLLKKAEA
jgi:hypothetical protein